MLETPLPVPYFLARPTGAPRAGIVVLMEGNGMGWQLLRVCERLAGEGYVVAAPDVYHRLADEEGDWQRAFSTLRDEDALDDIRDCVARLRQAHGAGKVGITGFCMGGRLTYLAAISGVGADAAAPFYGARIERILGEPTCPIRLFFGGRDQWIPPEAIAAVQAHHGERVVVYPDADHGFMHDGSERHHAEAAADAWRQLLTFFAEHLA